MPNVEITYTGLIRNVVGHRREALDMENGATLGQLLEEIVRRHGPEARRFLLDGQVTGEAGLLPHAIVAVNGVATRDTAAAFSEGAQAVQILVLSPMMIGG